MRELGQLLRERRIALGFDLGDIESRTKIRKRYLMALEEGDWDILPGSVYARGFVRSYADVVGLDGMELLSKYIDQNADKPAQTPSANGAFTPSKQTSSSTKVSSTDHTNGAPGKRAPSPEEGAPLVFSSNVLSDPSNQEATRNRNREQPVSTKPTSERPSPPRSASVKKPPSSPKLFSGRRFSGASQIGVVAGTLIIIGVVIFVLQHKAGRGSAVVPPSNTLQSALSNHVGSGATSNGSTMNTTYGGGSTNTASNLTTSTVPATTITSGPLNNGVQIFTVRTTSPLNVKVSAVSGNCWVAVSSDGKSVDPNDTLVQGQMKTWIGNNSVQMRLGNVMAVQMSVNGVTVQLPNVNSPVTVILQK